MRFLVNDDERRRPGIDFIAGSAPAFLSGALVEGDDERLALVIPDDDDGVAVESGGAALAKLVAHRLVAEVLLPDRRSLHVEGVDAARLERRNHDRAVGDDRRRRPRAPLLVAAFVRRVFPDDALPRDLAVLAVDRHNDVFVGAWCLAARRVRLGLARANRDGRRQEELLAPDDRRPGAASGDRFLPSNVLGLAPFDWRLGRSRDTCPLGPPPLRPVPVGVCGGQRDPGERNRDGGQNRGGEAQPGQLRALLWL